MARQGSKKYGTEMPDILFVIDNDYEQRYYRSPEAFAKGVCGWFDDKNGKLHAYRRIDEGFDPAAVLAQRDKHVAIQQAEFANTVGSGGYQPNTPQGNADWAAWLKIDKVLEKAKLAAVAAVLRRVR